MLHDLTALASRPLLIVVEDDSALLQSIAFSFETEGYDVRAYPSGEALLDEPDLPARGCMVLDYLLPGEDGLAILARLRARGVKMPAVLITTANPKVLDRARQAEATVVEKPLMARTLLDEVGRQLELQAG